MINTSDLEDYQEVEFPKYLMWWCASVVSLSGFCALAIFILMQIKI